MIDSIRFTTHASLKPYFRNLHNIPFDWNARAIKYHEHQGERLSTRIECPLLDLRIHIYDNYPPVVEACLPKILFGHNGCLIVTQEHLDWAMGWLNYFLFQFLVPNAPDTGLIPGFGTMKTSGHFTRIDMPWQFPYESGIFIALREARHDKIRSSASIIRGSTVSLKGSFLEITAYDKVRQLRLGNRFEKPIYRVEFRLRKKALTEVYKLPDGRGYTKIDLDWCRRTMRLIAAELHCDIQPIGNGTLADYVAYLESMAPTVKPLETYIRMRKSTPQTERKFRKEVESRLRHQRPPVPFESFFPEQGMPAELSIHMPEIEIQHSKWLAEQNRVFDELQAAMAVPQPSRTK